jgi:glucose/arabinose dehydrogenase
MYPLNRRSRLHAGHRSALLIVPALMCILGVSSTASAQLKATLVAGGFNSPVGFVQDPSDPTVQMVLEQGGHVRVLKNGVTQSADFLDISALLPTAPLGERGLLGLAFAPDYAVSRRVYVSYTNTGGHSVISRYLRSTGNPLQADSSTRFDLVWPLSPTNPNGAAYITQPYTNHNGGNIAFGPDGYLYFGLGDGGSGNDPQHNAQNPLTLLGKMLRLDVSVPASDPKGYAIPPSNPFAGRTDVLNEIWIFGLRNPWRWSFDARRAGSTGALVIGDVGQDAWEEVDYVPLGGGGRNLGWGNREGAHANANYTGGAPPAAAPLPVRDPIWEYSHGVGHSITGGVVYRGRLLGPAYVGRYFVADYAYSKVWSLGLILDGVTGEATSASAVEHSAELGSAAASISSFGVDAAGEIYVVNYGGTIYRIERASGGPVDGCPVVDPYLAAGGGVCVGGVWYSPVSGADFNTDGSADIFFQNTSNQLYAWFMAGHALMAGSLPSPNQLPADTLVVGTADLSGDGKPDLLLQNQQTGAVSLWVMNGVTRTATQTIPIANNTPWHVMATADLDHDGHADIVWQNFATGQIFVWFMTSSGGVANHPVDVGYAQDAASTILSVGSTARIVGAADLNGDGKADLIWQDGAGNLAAWYMDGRIVTAGLSLTPARVGAGWTIKAVTDLNGDQHPDLIWQNPATGDLYVWYLIGTQMVRGVYVSPSRINTAWTIVGPK